MKTNSLLDLDEVDVGSRISPIQPREDEADVRSQSAVLQFPTDEVMLTGDLEIPAKARGLVLFAHGSGSSRRSPRNRAVAEMLRRGGLGTLLFDLLDQEEGIDDAYSGHLRFDISLLSRRLAIVTREIANDERSQHLAMGYFGASTGGAAALRAAAAPTLRATRCSMSRRRRC